MPVTHSKLWLRCEHVWEWRRGDAGSVLAFSVVCLSSSRARITGVSPGRYRLVHYWSANPQLAAARTPSLTLQAHPWGLNIWSECEQGCQWAVLPLGCTQAASLRLDYHQKLWSVVCGRQITVGKQVNITAAPGCTLDIPHLTGLRTCCHRSRRPGLLVLFWVHSATWLY